MFEPGSPDLPLLIDTMTLLGRLTAPRLPIRNAEDLWRPYLDDPEDSRLLAGGRLLYTDYKPLNVLVEGGRALLVDWTSPTRGPDGSTRHASSSG